MKSYNNIKVTLILGVIFYSISSCKENDILPLPENFSLQSPTNNSACLKGNSVSISTAQVVFTWSLSTDAANYQLIITDLITKNASTFTTTSSTYTATLPINAYYSWNVVATNISGKTTSDTWLFYLSGTATNSYAPFPADLTTPAFGSTISTNGGATLQVTFTWVGSDPDNDISSYAFYLDNSNATTQVIASQTATTTSQILSSGKTYYWKVVTTDKAGNISVSDISSFEIK